jgi:hypothetical protein
MEIPVLIEPRGEGGFVGTAPSLGLAASGASADDALKALEALVRERVQAGGRIASLEIPVQNPWTAMAGIFKDDPLFDEWQQAIAEYRREREADTDTL